MVDELLQLARVAFQVGQGPGGHAVVHGGLRHGGRNTHDQARVEGLGDEVVGTEGHVVQAVGGRHDVVLFFAGQLADRHDGGLFHAARDGGRPHVQRPAEDVREAQHVVDLVGEVGPPGGDHGVGPRRQRVGRQDLRIGVGQRQHQRTFGHLLDHVGLEHPAGRQPQEHVGAADDVVKRARVGLLREAGLLFVHQDRAAFVDHALDVGHPDVLQRQTHVHHQFQAAQGRRAGAGHHDLDLGDVLADDFQAVDEGRGHRDGGAVLVVVEDGDVHALAQLLFDVEAFRRLDVFQVDAAEGRFQARDDVDQLVGILFVDLDVEDVQAGEFLEQHGLAFHHGLGGQRADVTQAEDGRAVGDDADQVAAPRIPEGVVAVGDDFLARGGDPGGIGQGEVPLVGKLFGGSDRDFPGTAVLVIFERRGAQGFVHGEAALIRDEE